MRVGVHVCVCKDDNQPNRVRSQYCDRRYYELLRADAGGDGHCRCIGPNTDTAVDTQTGTIHDAVCRERERVVVGEEKKKRERTQRVGGNGNGAGKAAYTGEREWFLLSEE